MGIYLVFNFNIITLKALIIVNETNKGFSLSTTWFILGSIKVS